MRPAFDLIRRLLLTLALIVASMPVKASAAPCAPPARVAAPKAGCGMACCKAKAPMRAMACGDQKGLSGLHAPHPGQHELAASVDPCKCELKAAPSAPVVKVEAVVSAYDLDAFVAVTPAALPELPSPLEMAEPGIFGVDSGPPARQPRRSDSGRAPPVARA